jgi:hypothetical protein
MPERRSGSSVVSVLESMKLFFDLEGFVFVAGLDQQVIERAIEIKYADAHERPKGAGDQDRTGSSDSQRPADAAGAITGRDYIKKIFQVPFGLPDIDRSLLRELVENLVEGTRLTAPQRHELTGRILGTSTSSRTKRASTRAR